MRNTAMKDTLAEALNKSKSKLRAVKPPSKEQKARIERTKTRFQHRTHSAIPSPTPETESIESAAVAEPVPDIPVVDPTPAEIEDTLATLAESEYIAEEEADEQEPPIVAVAEHPKKVEAPASVPLPPELAWLEQDTPFQHYLLGIVNRLRDTKARLNFTLEQCVTREKALQASYDKALSDLVNEQAQIETLHSQIEKVNNNLASCALVAEQSVDIASLLAPPTKHVTSVPGERRKFIVPAADDPTVCRKADVLKFFQNNPGNWSAREVRENMPGVKQAHARKSVPPILVNLESAGKLVRVTAGVYRLA